MDHKAKICVYAICKNELKFVDKWLDNMSEADYIVVLDTGSTDGTYEKLKEDPRVTKVVKKQIKPWRFDVARNESMKLAPEDADFLVCTDFDELFHAGWAKEVRETIENYSDQGLSRILYNYAWSHDQAGNPTDIFKYDKIHTRDYHWVFPVHEVLSPIEDDFKEVAADISDTVMLEHFRDLSKPRAYYFDLLKLACEENPNDSHTRMLLAREYLLNNDHDNALAEYLNVAEMPDIDDENKHLVLIETLGRIASLYITKDEYNHAIWYATEFLRADSSYREPYFIMAEIYNAMGLYKLAIKTVEAGIDSSVRHYSWVERANTWTTWSDDILAVSYAGLGQVDEAISHTEACLEHYPNDVRLLQNYNKLLKAKLSERKNGETDE